MDFLRFFAFLLYAMLAAVVGLVAGILVCTVQPFGEYMIAGVRVHTRPDGLPPRLRGYAAPADGDPAKPLYFYGPARGDLRYVRQVTWSRWRGAAEWWGNAVFALLDPSEPVAVPLGVGLTVGLLAGLPFAVLLVAAIWLAHELVVDVPTAAIWSSATGLRAFDSARLSVLRIRVRCVACFERIPYPAYLCPGPGCNHTHWDIRPGRYGLLRRTCECGQRMPTMLLLGSAQKLNAICPHRACRQPLEYRPGEVPEVILPIFGSKGAGKTLLLHGMVKVLLGSNRPGIHVSAADSPTSARLDDLDAAAASHSGVPATPADTPRAYVFRLRVGRQRRIIQFLDAAGELFYDSQRSANLLYLGAANTFVLVIDPLSVSGFWDSLPTAARKRFTPQRSLAPHPELAFQQTAERIAQMAKPRAQHRLAIVFSRADLLGTEYGPSSADTANIRKWAIDDVGLAGLLRQAEAEFREIAFFHTAAFGRNEESLNTLVHWLMRAEGITPGLQKPLSGSR
jgi:hypothetical protein